MKEKVHTCLNCNTPFGNNDEYCTKCGQNKSAVKLSVKQILYDAFNNFFAFDSRLAHTIKDIFKPYLLAKTYVEGKRKYYVNPAKLFLFSLISLISLFLFTAELGNNKSNEELIIDATQLNLKNAYDSIAQQLSSPTNDFLLDTIRKQLFKDTSISDELVVFNANIFDVKLEEFNFTKTDMANLTVDEMLEKYEINEFKDRLIVGQFLHFLKDTTGGIRFIVKNFTYVILLLVFLAALILKLLHIRRPFYYVEHLVLLLYGHILAFILIIPLLFNSFLSDNGENIALIGTLSILVFQFISFKKYYKQGKFKTLLKMTIFNISYFFLFLLCSVIIGFLLLLIF